MPMTPPSIDFERIVAHGGAQTAAFEELSSQLARHTTVSSGSTFQRNGRGADLGVECLWILPDGTKWGWQAKFVVDVDGLKAQVEKSLASALTNHKTLTRYYVCIPFDPSAAPGRGRSERQKIDAYKVEWEALAVAQGMNVTIDFWTAAELADRLLALDIHGGRRQYWFGEPVFTGDWFDRHVAAAIQTAGPRYTPALNIGHALSPVLAALGGTGQWDDRVAQWNVRLESVRRDWSESVSAATDSDIAEFPKDILPLAGDLTRHLAGITAAFAIAADGTYAWGALQQVAADASVVQRQVESGLREALEKKHGLGAAASKRFREYEAEYNARFPASHYDRAQEIGEALAAFTQWLGSVDVRAFAEGVLFLSGPAGIGKTHSVCDAAVERLRSELCAIVLHGFRFRDGAIWDQVRVQLGLGGEWSMDALLDAMDAAAEASGRPLVFFVDALNESQPRTLWRRELPGLILALRARTNLRLCVTCRAGFSALVKDDTLDVPQFEHPGFSGIEFDACQSFFRHYGLEPPVGPLFDPEFSNPLFLKLVCKALQATNQRRLPHGWTGFRTVFRAFLDERDREWEAQRGTLVRGVLTSALERLAVEMAQRGCRSLPIPDAIGTFSKGGINGADVLEQLLRDELLMCVPGAGEGGILADSPEEVVFAHERLGDHLQVQASLRELETASPIPQKMLTLAVGVLTADVFRRDLTVDRSRPLAA